MMPALDETDLEILRLLADDGRRSWRQIGDEVGLSGPAVSDRVQRMTQAGVIEGFTVDVDRGKLGGGVPVLVTLDVEPGETDAVRDALLEADEVEHVFVTADGDVVAQARVPRADPGPTLAEHTGDAVRDVTLRVLVDVQSSPGVDAPAFALTCDECGNTVTEEGATARLGGEIHHFCCTSCRANFVDRYERIQEGA